VSGKDRKTLKTELKAKREAEEKQRKYHEDIKKGKCEKRLTETETKEFIQSIIKPMPKKPP